jgi:outer membrane biosynthesis protein TonB
MAKKIKRYKVGCDSETYAISMVDMPAIESDFVALEKQEEEKVQVFLESNERHMVYGAALIPDKDIYRNNGEQEFYISFTKESIEKMSQEFMKEYRQNEVTLDHEEMANDITITESWLVEDSYKDKANALGINVPEGTWMVGMKVNQIDVWERVKSGELKGFSVESMISLEEFSKNDNNMNIETNDMGFWSKMKEVLAEAFSKKEEPAEIEPTNIDLEAEPQAEPQPTVEAPKVEEPKPEEPKVEEPKVEEPKPQEEPKQEEAPKAEEPKDNHLEELINSLKEEIAALKTSNGELQEKIKDMGKQPSANPVNTNAKPSANSTYSAWREQMAKYM